MTDKEKIRAEVERQYEILKGEYARTKGAYVAGMMGALDYVEQFINFLSNESSKQIRWRRIYKDERLPCPAYLWSVAFERYAPYWEGKLIPNIEGCKVGADTWYLPVSDLVSLYKEPE